MLTGRESREELVAFVKRLIDDNHDLAQLFHKRARDHDAMFNEHHALVAKIESLERIIERHEQKNEERRQRRLDRIKTKMLEGIP